MKKKQSLSVWLCRVLDIQAESFSKAPRITLSGDGRVLVEGHRGLLEYGAEQVTAARAGGRIQIKGEGLNLVAMNKRELLVSGQIWAVEME